MQPQPGGRLRFPCPCITELKKGRPARKRATTFQVLAPQVGTLLDETKPKPIEQRTEQSVQRVTHHGTHQRQRSEQRTKRKHGVNTDGRPRGRGLESSGLLGASPRAQLEVAVRVVTAGARRRACSRAGQMDGMVRCGVYYGYGAGWWSWSLALSWSTRPSCAGTVLDCGMGVAGDVRVSCTRDAGPTRSGVQL